LLKRLVREQGAHLPVDRLVPADPGDRPQPRVHPRPIGEDGQVPAVVVLDLPEAPRDDGPALVVRPNPKAGRGSQRAQLGEGLGLFSGHQSSPFESATVEGLIAVHKKFNLKGNRDLSASVRRIQRHGIRVVGSFIMGLDTDERGIGELIARAAEQYGVDMASVLFLTPLPGTTLYGDMERQGRIIANNYPGDWRYYTLGYPVAHYRNFTWTELTEEMRRFCERFHSYPNILRRVVRIAVQTRSPMKALVGLVMNLTQRSSHRFHEAVSARRALASTGRDSRISTREEAAVQPALLSSR
jgi:hypothetical protein